MVHLLLLLGLLPTACSAGEGSQSKPPPFLHQGLHESLAECAKSFNLIDGDWAEDLGDASFYGLAYYVRMGTLGQDASALQWAQAAARRSLAVIRTESIASSQGAEVLMSALGLMEYMHATGDRSDLPDLDEFFMELTDFLELLGYYVPLDMPDLPYGPTSISALVGLTLLQRAYLLGGEGADQPLAVGVQMAARLHERAWNGSYYEFSDSRSDLYLYPNVAMIILYARLYQLNGDRSYLERAESAYAGIQPLRVPPDGLAGPGRYLSPYSAPSLQSDYTTLSSQNYLILALMLLYEISGEPGYLREIDPVLDFIQDHLQGNWCLSELHEELCEPTCAGADLCVAGSCRADQCSCGLLHHWIEGRLAEPGDGVHFCAGCNHQLLYLLWYRQHAL